MRNKTLCFLIDRLISDCANKQSLVCLFYNYLLLLLVFLPQSRLMNSEERSPAPRIYHERQSKQFCALHTLNNLFQSPTAFTKKDLDTICNELAPQSRLFNPHRSFFGLGCYDVNVIILALAKKDLDVVWFDKRKDPSRLKLDKIFGFVLNVPNIPSYGFLAQPLNYIPVQAQVWSSQKHWIAIKRIGNDYYNLDSKLISPKHIGNDESLLQYLRLNNSSDKVEILIVISKQISEDQSWIE